MTGKLNRKYHFSSKTQTGKILRYIIVWRNIVKLNLLDHLILLDELKIGLCNQCMRVHFDEGSFIIQLFAFRSRPRIIEKNAEFLMTQVVTCKVTYYYGTTLTVPPYHQAGSSVLPWIQTARSFEGKCMQCFIKAFFAKPIVKIWVTSD